MTDLHQIGSAARRAFQIVRLTSHEQRCQAIQSIANSLREHSEAILQANRRDVERGRETGLSKALLDRLSLEGRLEALAKSVEGVAELADPLALHFDAYDLPNGLQVHKRRVPLGVLGVIYEARPNVTVDVAVVALKAGNCAILRGGKEALATNRALTEAVQAGLERAALPIEAVQLIQDPDRGLVEKLLQLDRYVDMIIPRGGAGLHDFCKEHARMPVITGGLGVCHLYVDPTANLSQALEIVANAKMQRPTVCNALDTLLVHGSVAAEFLPKLAARLNGVEFVADERALALLPEARPADLSDWDREWLSLVLGVRVVESLDEAMEHIEAHSSGHSDGILSQDREAIEHFLNRIDSAALFVNASTRFHDGEQLGLGAEVAISTQKLHARGPVGPGQLTSYKWVVIGQGQVRS